jgi:hypothetical protein
MGRLVLIVLGVLLALYVVFGFLIPALFGLLKLMLVVAVIGVLVVDAVTVLGKMSK